MYTYNKTSTPNILNSTPYISIHLTKEKKERIRYSYFFVLWQTQTLKWPKKNAKLNFGFLGIQRHIQSWESYILQNL